jgi:hypothetical protein
MSLNIYICNLEALVKVLFAQNGKSSIWKDCWQREAREVDKGQGGRDVEGMEKICGEME